MEILVDIYDVVLKFIRDCYRFFLEDVVATFMEEVSDIFRTIRMKDPCVNCIVKPCCTYMCSKKSYVSVLIYPHSSLKKKKLHSGSIIMGVVSVFSIIGITIIGIIS
jgi:hypothetical protein